MKGLRLVCPLCGYNASVDDAGWPTACPRCGSPLSVDYGASRSTLRRVLWESKLRHDQGVWSFYPLLPTERVGVSLGEAWTPLLKASRLAERVGLKTLYVKNEGLNPTGTFIDRGSAVEIEAVIERGWSGVVVPGLGDLASSLSAYAVPRGLQVVAVIPPSVEASKVYSIVLRRAMVVFEDKHAKRVQKARRLAELKGYGLVTALAPGLLEGYRTILYEVYAMGVVPDVVVVPVGDGILAISIYKAATELAEVVGDTPRIIGVRVEEQGVGLNELAVEQPLALDQARKLIEATGGRMVSLSAADVYMAVRVLAGTEGVLADPAGAAGVASLPRLVEEGAIDRGETVLVLLTGGGSRDPLLLLEAIKTEPELSRRMKPVWDTVPYLSHVKRRILQLLAERGTMHTYAIWKQLQSEGLKLSLATVHQHVKSLEADGLIAQVRREGRRILYALTAKGYEALRLTR